MRFGRAIDRYAILGTFAEAESDSERWRTKFEQTIGAPALAKLRGIRPADWPPYLRAVAMAALLAHRGGFVVGLLELPGDWFEATVMLDEIAALQATTGFAQITPTLRIGDILDEFANGNLGDGGFNSDVKVRSIGFDLSRIRGRPVLAAESRNGPFTIVEGTTRLATMLSLSRTGRTFPDPIPVYVGIVPWLLRWGGAKV
jgi:hypothetical protein